MVRFIDGLQQRDRAGATSLFWGRNENSDKVSRKAADARAARDAPGLLERVWLQGGQPKNERKAGVLEAFHRASKVRNCGLYSLSKAICDDTKRQIEESSLAFDIHEKTRLGHRGLQFLQALASRLPTAKLSRR